jgi:hypothetical protein
MFEQALFLRGYDALALTPAKTENIDADMAKEFNLHKVENTEILPWHQTNWELLTRTNYPVPDAEDMFYRLRRFYTDEKSGWQVVMSHQLHTLLPQTFQGPWQHKWVQLFGPFGLLAKEGCTINLPHIPSAWGIVVPKNENIGKCMIMMDGREIETGLREFDDHRYLIMATEPVYAPSVITISPDIIVHGIAVAEFMPWMLQPSAFDITKWLPFVK